MKSIFDKELQRELVQRIGSVNANCKSQWGKMTVHQMLLHCTFWDAWMLGINQTQYKQAFIGKLFGKFGLKRMVKDDNPLDKNAPTSKEFRITETTCDIGQEKAKWIDLIEQYQNYNNPNFIHVFFGKMTKEEVGILAYKHADHHLRQFGV